MRTISFPHVPALSSVTRSSSLTRRRLLRNAALAALLAPVLRKRDAQAAAAAPRRIILLFSPNGPIEASGPASGKETAFDLHDWWKPLERHKADGLFLSHMACTGSGVVTGNGHGLGGQIWSGYGTGNGGQQYANQGETIDQLIGKRLQAEGRAGVRRSLVWGATSNSRAGGTGDAFCAAANRNITPEIDPAKAWSDLFAGFMAPARDDAEARRVAALVQRERSVLDFVNEDCKALRDALGAEGMRLLDDHCSSLRAMEQKVGAGLAAGAGGSCAKPASPGAADWANPERIDGQMAAFIDLMAMTLACELSHVIAFQFAAQAGRNRLAAKYGVPSSPTANSGDSGPAHHPWTHQGASSARTTALRAFTRFYASEVALLVDKLKATTDASGKPLLDSTLVVWLSELGGSSINKDAHQTGSLPVVLFGPGQGTFKVGRYLRGKSEDRAYASTNADAEAGRDLARLLVSVVRYMGLSDVRTVGRTGVSGPLETLHG